VQKIRGVGAVYVYTFRDGFDGPFDLIPHSDSEKTMSDDIYSDFFLIRLLVGTSRSQRTGASQKRSAGQ
jgi:hypothetical protein